MPRESSPAWNSIRNSANSLFQFSCVFVCFELWPFKKIVSNSVQFFFLWAWVQRLSQLCRSLGEKEVSPPCSLATLIMSGRPMEDLIGQATWIVANWIHIKKQSKTNNWWNFQDLMTCNDFIMYSAYKLPIATSFRQHQWAFLRDLFALYIRDHQGM